MSYYSGNYLVGKFTTSSPLCIHYSHYNTSTKCNMSGEMYARQLTIISRNGDHCELFLRKKYCVCLVEKQRCIQLYEANLDIFQQFIVGKEIKNAPTNAGFLLKEHLGKKVNTAEDTKLVMALTNYLSRKTRNPMMIVSVDATQYYNRVNYAIMSLVWYSLIGKLGLLAVLLTCL